MSERPSLKVDRQLTERIIEDHLIDFDWKTGEATHSEPVADMEVLVAQEEIKEKFGLTAEAVADINGKHLIVRSPEGGVFLLTPQHDEYDAEKGDPIPVAVNDLRDGSVAVEGAPYDIDHELSIGFDEGAGVITMAVSMDFLRALNSTTGYTSIDTIRTARIVPIDPVEGSSRKPNMPLQPPQNIYYDTDTGDYVRGHVSHGWGHPSYGAAVIQTPSGKVGIRQRSK